MRNMVAMISLGCVALTACKVAVVNPTEVNQIPIKEVSEKLTPMIPQNLGDTMVIIAQPEAGLFNNLKEVKKEKNQAQKEFAYWVNTMPSKRAKWVTTGDLLWNVYKTRLMNIDISSSETITEREGKLLKESQDTIKKYRASFNTFSSAYLSALEKYQKARLNNESASMEYFRNTSTTINAQWVAQGFKNNVERAVHIIEIIEGKSSITQLAVAREDLSHCLINDPNQEDYYYTSYYPELNVGWQKVELPSDSLALADGSRRLTVRAPKVAFEFNIIHINRPWFHPELLRLVTVAPAIDFKISYVKSLLLVRNIHFKYNILARRKIELKGVNDKSIFLKRGQSMAFATDSKDKVEVVGLVCYFEK